MADLVDSYDVANADADVSIHNDAYPEIAQSFTGNGQLLHSAVFYLKKFGSPTGNAAVKLYAHSGTYGTSSVPTGSALDTSDNLDVSGLTTSFVSKTFTFTGGYELVNGTKYTIVLEFTGGNWDNHIISPRDDYSSTHDGNFANKYGGDWYAEAKDLIFYVYGETGEAPSFEVKKSSQFMTFF